MCDTIGDPTRCEGLIVVVLFLLLLLEEDVSMWSIFLKFLNLNSSSLGVETADFFDFCLIVISSYR